MGLLSGLPTTIILASDVFAPRLLAESTGPQPVLVNTAAAESIRSKLTKAEANQLPGSLAARAELATPTCIPGGAPGVPGVPGVHGGNGTIGVPGIPGTPVIRACGPSPTTLASTSAAMEITSLTVDVSSASVSATATGPAPTASHLATPDAAANTDEVQRLWMGMFALGAVLCGDIY